MWHAHKWFSFFDSVSFCRWWCFVNLLSSGVCLVVFCFCFLGGLLKNFFIQTTCMNNNKTIIISKSLSSQWNTAFLFGCLLFILDNYKKQKNCKTSLCLSWCTYADLFLFNKQTHNLQKTPYNIPLFHYAQNMHNSEIVWITWAKDTWAKVSTDILKQISKHIK